MHPAHRSEGGVKPVACYILSLDLPARQLGISVLLFALAGCQRAGSLPELKLDGQSAAVRRMLTDALDTARLHPGDAAPSGHLGKILLANRLPEPALTAFERARVLDPGSAAWHYYAGAILQERKNFAAARHAFDEHVKRDPSSYAGQVRLAESLFASGDKAASLDRFATAIGQRPKAARALYGMGLLLQSQGNAEEAGRFFERAIEAFPRYRLARFALAETWRARGNEAKATELLAGYEGATDRGASQAIPFDDPLMAEVRRLDAGPPGTRVQALQLARAGRFGRAVTLLEGALREDPRQADFRSDLMVYLTRLGKWEQAEEQFRALVNENPSNAFAHALRGELLVELGKCEEAVESFDTALEIDPAQPKAHVGLGECQLSLGRDESAERHFRQAIQAQPEDAKAHTRLGLLLASKRRFAEAVPHLVDAAAEAAGKERASVLLALGQAYESTGRSDEARETLATARVLASAYGLPDTTVRSAPARSRRAARR